MKIPAGKLGAAGMFIAPMMLLRAAILPVDLRRRATRYSMDRITHLIHAREPASLHLYLSFRRAVTNASAASLFPVSAAPLGYVI
jgi:hypothetical protein